MYPRPEPGTDTGKQNGVRLIIITEPRRRERILSASNRRRYYCNYIIIRSSSPITIHPLWGHNLRHRITLVGVGM